MRQRALIAVSCAALAACGGGGARAPLSANSAPPELVFCRAERDRPTQGSLRSATRRGLSDARLPEAAGLELDVRVHPDGNRIVFARERRGNDIDSREIFVAKLDGSALEARITANGARDDSPCWSGDGERIVFASNRDAGRRIWTMQPDGSDPAKLFDDGSEQTDPDTFGDLVVFARWRPLAADPRRELWLYDDVAGSAARLTDGGSGIAAGVPGDFDPCFAPNGDSILFVRTVDGDRHRLMRLDRASLVVTPLGDGGGDDRWPRWSPRADAMFVARGRPADGQPGLRLFELDANGDDPVAVFPDGRFEYPGFDVLPSIGARIAAGAPSRIAAARMEGSIAFGSGAIGSTASLDDPDGIGVSVLTALFEDRQRAGLRVVVPLAVDDPTAIARLAVRARVSIGRADGDANVRLTLTQISEDRNDTILEREATGTGFEDYAFVTQGLQYVDRDGDLIVTVIADLPDGERVDMTVDELEVTVRTDS